MQNIAIGDIHGSVDALRTLLNLLDIERDRLIFLGDYIDRGPHSRQVLDVLEALASNPNHVFLRGNHDEWLLRARRDKRWFKTWVGEGVGGRETLRSYGASSFDLAALDLVPEQHFAFLEQTRLFFQTEYEIFVHASLSWLEPEETDPQQLLWRPFEEIAPHPSGKRVICGHTKQPGGVPRDNDYAVCIDTLTVSTGWLSALNVETNWVTQADSEGRTRQFALGDALADS
jgi:serine/threonine protein phosphatase 1